MIDFKLHSLSNFSKSQIQTWVDAGIASIATKCQMPVEQFKRLIEMTNVEIAERAKHPSININTPERLALREKIKQDYFNLFKDIKRNRHAGIVLGQIASGKSSFCKELIKSNAAFVVDSDFIKQGYGSMEGLRKDFDEGKGTDQIHEEASQLSKQIITQAANMGYDLVIPKTGINYQSIENIIKHLKSQNYDVSLVYIDLPIEKCIERNFYRFVHEIYCGIPSRLVPFEVIERIDDNPFLTFAKFLSEKDKGLVDNFIALSNNVEIGKPMQNIPLSDILDYYNSKQFSGN